MESLLLFSVAFIFCVWGGYPLVLWMLELCAGNSGEIVPDPSYAPGVSVVVAAHNEGKNLAARVDSVFSSEYPRELIEVVVASDGSSDDTVEVVEKMKEKYSRIRLVEIKPQGGRSNAHNHAVPACSGEILVFTDAETVFEKDFLNRIVAPFGDERVGFSSGELHYRNITSTTVTKSAGFYWRYEFYLRKKESRLGVYAFGSGACCAVRRALYRDIPPTGDVDFTTPLDVVLQGYRCIHVPEAVAFDVMPETPEHEFRARIRMTAKNFSGTLSRWVRGNGFAHPVYTMVIFLHKIGRWVTPFFMLGALFSSIFLLDGHPVYILGLIVQMLFYALAFLGYLGFRVAPARHAYSFLVVNAGFLLGVLKALFGYVPNAYKPMSQLKN